MLYRGEVALLTGASGGIGRAIAEELINGGSDIAIAYKRNRRSADELALTAERAGCRSLVLKMDLRRVEEVKDGCQTVIDALGTPTIIANCAGVIADRPIAEMEEDNWSAVIDVNLSGAYRIIHELTPHMIRRRYGRIVNIASISALHGIAGQANYAAAKGGLVAMTRALARELGPFGIRVNAIAPGIVETEMTRHLHERVLRGYLSRTPLRRLGSPSDIAGPARFLLSSISDFVTGQVIVVDGGLTC